MLKKNNIDITVDFYSDKFVGRRSIVIEDKVSSSEHNQLKIYNNSIGKWEYENQMNSSECVYKVFYKTRKIDPDESKRVEDARWTKFGIDEISSFFSKYLNKTDSDVLNDYINHVMEIENCYKEISPKLAKEWNSINWETFFSSFIDEHFHNVEHKFSSYHGIYDSMFIYFDIPKNKFLKKVSFEIVIRSKLIPYLHPWFLFDKGNEWSAEPFIGTEFYDGCKKELDDLRTFVSDYNSQLIKVRYSKRAFGQIKENIDLNVNSKELAIELKRWVLALQEIIDSYNLKK